MFIIIEYSTSRDSCADKVKIVGDIDGEPILFGSGHSAGKHAELVCKLNYKVVEI